MRKVVVTLVVIIVVLVAAALIIPRFIDVNRYHDRIQAGLEKKLGRPVSLGQMHLTMFPPSIQVDNAVIGEDKSFDTGRPFAEAERLAISVQFWPLLRKQVEINSVELVRPRIEVVRNGQGVWNFASLGHPSEAEQAQPGAPPTAPQTKTAPSAPSPQPGTESKKPAEQFTLANLIITDGQLALTDQQKHQSRSVYDHIDANVRDFAPGRQCSLKVTAHLPGKGKQTVDLEGKAGPIQQVDLKNTPFDGDLRLDQVSLSSAQKFLNSPSLTGMEALISGRAHIKTAETKLASNGTIRLDDPVIRDVKVGYPITLDYNIADDLGTDVIQIDKGELKLGATPVTVLGTVDTRPNPAQINLKVTASNASISEAARLASAFGVAFSKSVDVNGQVDMNVQARGSAKQPQTTGQISARNLVISGKQLPQPVKVDAVQLALTPDTVHSNNFTATSGSTTVTGNVAIANYTAPNSTLTAALRIPGARISELLNIAKAAGVSAADNISGDGGLTLDVHAQGPTKNPSAMTFNGTGKIHNATLKVPNLNKPLQIHNSDITFSQNGATLQNMALTLGQSNITGSVSAKNFAAPETQFALKVDGRIGELLNMAKAAGVSAADNISGDGALALDVHGQGPAKNVAAMTFGGTGKIQNASLKVPKLDKPLQIHNSDITFTQNGVTLQNAALSLGQSNITGSVSVKNFAAPETQFALKVDGRIGELLNMAKAAGVSAVENISGDGALTLDFHGQGPTKNVAAMTFGGTGKIQNASLTGPNLNKPVQIHNSDIAFSRNGATLQNTAFSLGQSNATGTVSVKDFAAPQIQFTLNVDKVNVQELQQIFSAAPAQKRAAAQSEGWSLFPRAEAQNAPSQAAGREGTRSGFLYTSTGTGTVTIGTIQHNDLLLTNTHANVKIDRGLIEMNPLTSQLFNGQETGSVVIDLRPVQALYTVNLKMNQLDANKLLSSVSNVKNTVYGLLNANVNGNFSAASANEIAHNLNGTMKIDLTNGKLMNVDLLHELATVGQFLGNAIPATPKGFTDIVQLSGNFDIKQGVAQTNDLKATLSGGTVAGKGLINLADQTLNMHLMAVLNQDLSKQVGGTRVGGIMNTALANNQGELVVPVVVTGNLQHPKVAPDVQQIAQMKIQNLLPSTKNPGQLTTGILNTVTGHQGTSGTGQGKKQGVGETIQQILGGQQQQQNQPVQQQNQPAQQQNQGPDANQQPTPSQNPVENIMNQVLGGQKKSQPTPQPSPN
jgi:uncharacterized protein involved in outer membrane biogenesis